MPCSPFRTFHLLIVLSAVAISGSTGQAAIVWSESVNGNLSNNQASPTSVTLALGTNSVIGSVIGPLNVNGTDAQNFITVHVPVGTTLSGFVLKSYTSTDAQGFTGFQKGSTFVGSPLVASSYTGYAHFGTGATNGPLGATNLVGVDLLPLMANPILAVGAQGFSFPLGSGDFTFLIQQTGSALTSFQFDFIVTAPEPATFCTLGALCATGLIFRRTRRAPKVNPIAAT